MEVMLVFNAIDSIFVSSLSGQFSICIDESEKKEFASSDIRARVHFFVCQAKTIACLVFNLLNFIDIFIE